MQKFVFFYGVAYFLHEALEEAKIVVGGEGVEEEFVGFEEMANIGFAKIRTDVTGAVFV